MEVGRDLGVALPCTEERSGEIDPRQGPGVDLDRVDPAARGECLDLLVRGVPGGQELGGLSDREGREQDQSRGRQQGRGLAEQHGGGQRPLRCPSDPCVPFRSIRLHRLVSVNVRLSDRFQSNGPCRLEERGAGM